MSLSKSFLFLSLIDFILLNLLFPFNQLRKLVYLLRLSRWNLRLSLVALYALLVIDIVFFLLKAVLDIYKLIVTKVLILHVSPQIHNQVNRLLQCYVHISHPKLKCQKLKKSHFMRDLKLVNEVHQKMRLVLYCFFLQKALWPVSSFLLVRLQHLFLRKDSDKLLKLSNRRRNHSKGKRFHLSSAYLLDERTVHRHDVLCNRSHRITFLWQNLCDH